jgi:hypothetical protein
VIATRRAASEEQKKLKAATSVFPAQKQLLERSTHQKIRCTGIMLPAPMSPYNISPNVARPNVARPNVAQPNVAFLVRLG